MTRRWCRIGPVLVFSFVLMLARSVEGQYQHGYIPRDRPRILDGRLPYESRYPGIDLEKRIKEDGDSRCDVLQIENLPLTRSIDTPYGSYEGKIVYLCDTFSTPRYDRPVRQGGRGGSRERYPTSAIAYLGIPYAEPPLGYNRFRDPQPIQFRGNVEAKKFRAACLQHTNFTGATKGIDYVSEDCLYLNIYTPRDEVNRGQRYAVMVYLHDGEFSHGSGNTFPGHMLAATQEVVVVTLNYRLGALGFLSTGDNSSAGNYGLMDQRAAIHWVYHNIERFGGDQERITLFGPGAGAAAAGIHLMQQIYGEDLHIRRVIAMSGSATADWASIDDAIFVRNISRLYGEQIGCWATDSWKLVECLKRKSNNSVEFTLTTVNPKRGWLPWGPVLDRNTRYKSPGMPHTPLAYLEHKIPLRGRVEKISYMTGVSRNDASFIAKDDEELRNIGYQINWETFDLKLRAYAKTYNYTINEEAIIDAIHFMYTPWMQPENSSLLMEEYVNMLTDSLYVAPMDRMVKLLLEINVPVYQYVLNYSLTSEYFQRSQRDWDRVPHDLESILVSGAPFMDAKFYPSDYNFEAVTWSDGDRNMSQLLMEAWANFAKEGAPTPKSLFGVVNWRPVMKGNLQYLSLNATYYEAQNSSSFMFRDYRQKQAQFWNSYIPGIFGRAEHFWPYWNELPWEYENRVYKTSLYFVSAVAGLFLFLAFVGFCCYCRASRYMHDMLDEIDYDKASRLKFAVSGAPGGRAMAGAGMKSGVSRGSLASAAAASTRHVRFANDH
ncbi:neuroligin-4 [Tropilaelaps mercedesae]|uniref:Neuroligin-4 n=1 Tax=Tropilaelaps mercedesae TaxID=418985 RepID=A0A1V9Y181_9ACAR|nr:neuroligin-4 [Tropilaelaps mercedesae]